MKMRASLRRHTLLLCGALVALVGSGCMDKAAACRVNGSTYAAGESFSDGCNTCTCMAAGSVACTTRACLGDGGPEAGDGGGCDFSSSYDYGAVGGFRASIDRSFLSPDNHYLHTRSSLVPDAGPELACAPALPPCGALDVITAYDIEVHDLPLADVQSALAQMPPPLYGYDSRPVDGSVFEFKRADGRGFLVGESCAGRPAPCTPIPPGVAQLTQRLQDLDAQQLAKPACDGLRTP
jgi:hypothetical protein